MRLVKTLLAAALLVYATLAAFSFPLTVARGRPWYVVAGTAAGIGLSTTVSILLFRSAYPRKRRPAALDPPAAAGVPCRAARPAAVRGRARRPTPEDGEFMPTPPRPTRRRFLKRTATAALTLGLPTGAYAWRIEPHWVHVVRRDLPVAGLPAALTGRTIVQVSDLHAGPVVDTDYLARDELVPG